jgi:hypothetical protein
MNLADIPINDVQWPRKDIEKNNLIQTTQNRLVRYIKGSIAFVEDYWLCHITQVI